MIIALGFLIIILGLSIFTRKVFNFDVFETLGFDLKLMILRFKNFKMKRKLQTRQKGKYQVHFKQSIIDETPEQREAAIAALREKLMNHEFDSGFLVEEHHHAK